MTNGFDGRVAIVTGGGKGIGGASAAALLDAGAKVEVFDIDCRSGAHLEGRPGYGCTQVDVRDADAVRAAVDRVAATHGGIDFLVNNAGIVAPQTLDAMAPADWQRILDVNLTGSFNCAQSVVAHMKRRRSGAIVNIASVAGKNISGTGGVHYTASKWGVVGLTRHLAYELAPWHIRVNTVCPGPVLTDLIHAVMDGPAKDRFAAAVPLGRWVMGAAIRQIADWHREIGDGGDWYLSVNVSSREVGRRDLPGETQALLEQHRVPAGRLKLEVTESVLMQEPEAAARILAELRRLGIRLCIDDFGTGYSSLAYLHRFPFDTLKIDRSFVMNRGRGVESGPIIASIAGLGRSLGKEVVAEGAETAADVERLRELGCDAAQGYYFSPPLPADRAAALLAHHLKD